MSPRKIVPILIAIFLVAMTHTLRAGTISIISGTTWLTTSPSPGVGWNTDLNFDTSQWINATTASSSSSHIWYGSTLSADSPNNAWFRFVFTLTAPLTSASAIINFDDNGEFYLNGLQLVDDTGGGASQFNTPIDPRLFVVGQNLIAVHGINTIAPDNSISVNLTLTTPEPASLSLLAAGSFILLSRRRANK